MAYSEISIQTLTPEQAAQYAGFNWSHSGSSTDHLTDPTSVWGMIGLRSGLKGLALSYDFKISQVDLGNVAPDYSAARFGIPGQPKVLAVTKPDQPFTFTDFERVNRAGETIRVVQERLAEVKFTSNVQELSDKLLHYLKFEIQRSELDASRLARVGVLTELLQEITENKVPSEVSQAAQTLQQLGIDRIVLDFQTKVANYLYVTHLLSDYAPLPTSVAH